MMRKRVRQIQKMTSCAGQLPLPTYWHGPVGDFQMAGHLPMKTIFFNTSRITGQIKAEMCTMVSTGGLTEPIILKDMLAGHRWMLPAEDSGQAKLFPIIT